MCRIMTSNYSNCTTENGISIDGGKIENFKGRYLSTFLPTKDFFKTIQDNIVGKSKEETIKFYVEEYYKQVLSNLDPIEVLDSIPNESILLCYEDNIEFSYRHLVAFWLELFLGITTSEVIENPVRETVKKAERPEYLKEVLEDVIKENYEMNGFDTIKDAYSYNKSTQNKKLIYKNN